MNLRHTYRYRLSMFFSVFVIVFYSLHINAANKTASTSGNWNSTTTWGGSIPTASDAVTINKDITVTVNVANAVCASLNINNNKAGTANITFLAASILTVSGIVKLSGSSSGQNGTLNMSDGGTLICNSFSLGSGTIVFNAGSGTIQLNATNTLPQSAAFSSFNTLIINSGTTTTPNSTITCNSLQINKNYSGTAKLVFNSNNATVKVNGTVTIGGNGNNSYVGQIVMSLGGLLDCNNIVLGNSTGPYLTSGSGTIHLNADNSLPLTIFNNLTIKKGTTTTTGPLTIWGKLTIGSAPGVGILAPQTNIVTVKGDWDYVNTINGFIETNSTVIFNGTTTQTIRNAGTFYNLSIDNTNPGTAVFLESNITIKNNLTFINGIIDTGNDTVFFESPALASGASNRSHIKGIAAKLTNGYETFDFPIGDGFYYRPIGIINPSASNVWSAKYTHHAYLNTTSVKPSDTALINHISKVEYWELSPLKKNGSTKIKLTWDDRSNVTNPSNLLIAHWDETNRYWEDVGFVTIDINNQSITTSKNSWSKFSPFTLSSGSNDGSLPVELMEFNARLR